MPYRPKPYADFVGRGFLAGLVVELKQSVPDKNGEPRVMKTSALCSVKTVVTLREYKKHGARQREKAVHKQLTCACVLFTSVTICRLISCRNVVISRTMGCPCDCSISWTMSIYARADLGTRVPRWLHKRHDLRQWPVPGPSYRGTARRLGRDPSCQQHALQFKYPLPR